MKFTCHWLSPWPSIQSCPTQSTEGNQNVLDPLDTVEHTKRELQRTAVQKTGQKFGASPRGVGVKEEWNICPMFHLFGMLPKGLVSVSPS